MSDEQTFDHLAMSDRIQQDRHRRSNEFRRSAIARFIVSHANVAMELERAMRFSEIDPSDPLDCHIARLETEILGDFQKLFGIDLLALLTQPEPDPTPEREHPVKIGDVISGLRVVQTSWPEGDVPMYRLDGESDWRRLYSFSAPSPPPQP